MSQPPRRSGRARTTRFDSLNETLTSTAASERDPSPPPPVKKAATKRPGAKKRAKKPTKKPTGVKKPTGKKSAGKKKDPPKKEPETDYSPGGTFKGPREGETRDEWNVRARKRRDELKAMDDAVKAALEKEASKQGKTKKPKFEEEEEDDPDR